MRTPSDHTLPRISRRSYDKEALEADIREGVLKASTIAEKYGVEVSIVYVVKSAMKRDGRLYAVAAPEKGNDAKELSQDTIEQLQDLRDEPKTTTEIAAKLGLDIDAVMRVPARGGKLDRSLRHDDEEEKEEDVEEDESDDDGEYHPFACRGKVAGSDI
jgi:transposase